MPSANPAAADGGSNAPPPERNVAPSFLRRRDEGAAATVAASGMPHTTGSQPHNNNNTSPGSTTSNASIHNNHGGVPRPPHKASHSSTTNNNSATTTTAFFFEGLQQHPPPPPLTGIAATTTTTMRRKKVPHSSPHQQQQQHQYPNDDQASIERASTFSSIESAPDPHHLLTMDQHPPNLPTAFSSPPSVGTSSYTSHSPNNNRPSGMRRNGVVVAVNPLESEAETLILKALEHQEAKGRARADTDISTSNSVLAPNLPSDALRKAFLPVPDEDRLEAAGVSNQASAATVRRPSLASLLSHHTNDQPAFLHAAAADAQPTTFRGNNSNATTTEGALAKLTMMIEALDQQKHQQQLLDQTVSTSGGGDAFSQNANLVLHGRRRQSTLLPPATSTEVAPPSSNGAYVTQNWSKLRYAVQMTGALKDGTGGFPSSSAADLADDHHHGSNNDKTTSQDVEHGEGIKINDQGAAAEVDGADCTGGSSSDETSNQPAGAPVTNGKPLPEKELKAVAASATTKNKRRGKKKKNGASTKGAVQDLQVFCSKRRNLFFVYVNFLLFMMVPATGVAAILFYLAGNPPIGRVDVERSGNGTLVGENGLPVDTEKASISWWILFICVRQALTFSLAHLWQTFVIDFLCLNTKFFQSILGNLLTLLLVQSKGWPFIAVTWGLLDFGLLHGSSPFVSSWLYWQDIVSLFNEANPGGSVTRSTWNTRVLSVAVSVGLVVAIKRLWVGLFLGRKTIKNHSDDLQKVYKKILFLMDVATLARNMKMNPSYRRRQPNYFGMNEEDFYGMLQRTAEADDEVKSITNDAPDSTTRLNESDQRNLSESHRRTMLETLGAWEEPDSIEIQDNISISAILLFENLVNSLGNKEMFGLAWGDVSTRDLMIDNSERVFNMLVLGCPDPCFLKFDVLARIAKFPNGLLDNDILRDLIRLLRPNREGDLTVIDFVKSVDSVYKEAKLLRASIKNSRAIDKAFEKFINVIFYILVVCIVLSQIGIDPLALFLSLSSLILAFAWIIGSAAAKMFEGWLFILVRRPYNIGDRIHISNSETDTDSEGSLGWIVKDVTLSHTTVVLGATGEKATLSNGALAGSRVINMARSPNASISIVFKFATRAPFESIQIFDNALREFIKARPREWQTFSGFRVKEVVADLGYVEYSVLLTHRESWQQIGSIMDSKAIVASFCLELSKKLNLRFQGPPLPVDLAIVNRAESSAENDLLAAKIAALGGEDALKELLAMYEKNK